MIGLSSGSWAQVIINHPQVRHFTVVEINSGYLDLIPRYPAVASVLKNPKLELVIDDGRRWLAHNVDRKFDAIVMNTSFHWRAHTSNLLSVEFMHLAKRHLKEGGVLFYNMTGSGESQLTGLTVFKDGLLVANCLAVSDSPLNLDWTRWRRVLADYRIDGIPVLDLRRTEDRKRLEFLVALPMNALERADSLQDADLVRNRNRGKSLITDDNMGTEWGPMKEFRRH